MQLDNPSSKSNDTEQGNENPRLVQNQEESNMDDCHSSISNTQFSHDHNELAPIFGSATEDSSLPNDLPMLHEPNAVATPAVDNLNEGVSSVEMPGSIASIPSNTSDVATSYSHVVTTSLQQYTPTTAVRLGDVAATSVSEEAACDVPPALLEHSLGDEALPMTGSSAQHVIGADGNVLLVQVSDVDKCVVCVILPLSLSVESKCP